MTPINLRYLWLPKMRGKVRAYYRRTVTTVRDGERQRKTYTIPITDDKGNRLLPGEAPFLTAYERIHAGFELPIPERIKGSVAEIIEAYLGSGDFVQLESKTRDDYRRYLDDLKQKAGHLQAVEMPRSFVAQIRDRHAETPHKANRYVTVIKLLYAWAIAADRWRKLNTNPAVGVKRLKTAGGWRAWTSAEVAAFRTGAGPQMRLALMLALCTALRRGDCVRLQKSAYREGVIEVITSKRGVPVSIPAHRDLRAEMDAAERTDATTILVNPATGRPWRADTFSHAFAEEVKRLALPSGCTFHGLRKTAGKYLAEAGCSAHEIQAVLGCSLENAEYYCREASRRTLAASAVAKLERRKNTD